MMDAHSSALDLVAAASLVIFRQKPGGFPALLPELLMVERSGSMRFAAHAAVFPGGRIDPADIALAREWGDDLADAAGRIAAIRETLEETGLALGLDRQISAEEAAKARRLLQDEKALAPVLEAFFWRLDLAALTPYARWAQDRVGGFDTRFYLADLGAGDVELAVDATENTRAFWITARDALAQADAGALRVIFPTRRILERLALHGSFAQACTHAAAHPQPVITARRKMRGGAEFLTIPDGLGYPVTAQALAEVQRG